MQAYPRLRVEPDEETDEGVDGLKYPQVLERHFISLVVGPPGSGKTELITQLLCDEQFYVKKFNHVLFFAPQKFGPFELTDANWQPTLNLRWLFEKLANIKEAAVSKRKVNVLIVIDDLVADLAKLNNSQQMMSLFMNRRHILPNGMISFIITT